MVRVLTATPAEFAKFQTVGRGQQEIADTISNIHSIADSLQKELTAAGHEADGDHDDSTIVHVHFYAISIPTAENHGNSVEAKHKDHVSSSLDTFTSVPQTALLLAYQAEPATTVFVPDKSFAPAEFVQAQGHDPPCAESSVPRAPPA